MKSIVRAALIVSLLGSAACVAAMTSTPAWAADKSDQKVRASIAKPLNEAIKDAKANDFTAAMAAIKEAQAVDERTPFEDYEINSVLSSVAIQMKDYATAATATEAAADSPAMPDAEKAGMLHNALLFAVQAKQYDKGIAYGQQLQAANGLDVATESLLAEAYYEKADYAHAQQMAQMAIDASKAAGKAPTEAVLQIVMLSEAKQHNETGAQSTLENLAVNYNNPESWNELAEIAMGGKNVRDADALYILRLKVLVPDSLRPDDYTTLASVADLQSYSTEAYAVLQKGISSGKITAAQAGPTLAHARNGAAEDARELPTLASSALKSKSGEQDIKLAEDYWGYGRFADAETAARRAIGKGGLKDPSEGPMLLGMILVAEGKYDDAIQTLAQVNGTPSRKSVAHLWTLYAQAQQKAQGTTAQAPAH